MDKQTLYGIVFFPIIIAIIIAVVAINSSKNKENPIIKEEILEIKK